MLIVASVVIGSAFGLIATSTTTKYHEISISASVLSTGVPVGCPPIPSNFSSWAQLDVNANQTDLNLVSLTALTALPSISLTISLNETSSTYVYYHKYNITMETVTVPLPDYWKPGQDVDLTVNYYYSGANPTPPQDYPVGPVKVVGTTGLAC